MILSPLCVDAYLNMMQHKVERKAHMDKMKTERKEEKKREKQEAKENKEVKMSED